MLRLLLDENLNHRILRGLRLRFADLDVVIAQHAGLKGIGDSSLLSWAANERRIVVTHDLKTIPKQAYARIKAGQFMAGVIAIPKTLAIGEAIEDLSTLLICAEQRELENIVMYLPV